jgi:hypothetical protein
VINGLAASLYHLFEQQLCEFYRLAAWDKKAVIDGPKAVTKLGQMGVEVQRFPEWNAIDHLRLLANCVKHGEGRSCQELETVRPDLFERPEMRPKFKGPRQFVERPLSGEGVYLTVKEFDEMADRLKRFWEYIAGEIED